jgi:uncharacterized damage-inducible protein DinB
MKQTKWFERKFNFNSSENIFPSLLERLSGTPARLDEKIRSLPEEVLTVKIEGTWSIKENLGHLIDLEPLWLGRFEDIKNGETELRITDLTNAKTDLAGHNNKSTESLLKEFREIRNKTLLMLENMDEALIFKSALHPRLKTPLRTVDHFVFVAEHDDHHLARITEIAKLLEKK